MTKFTQSDIKKINQAQKLIQKLQEKQSLIYDTLLVNLPDLTKPEKDTLWDYCYNNYSHTLSFGKDGLKIEKIFPEPVPCLESDIDENTTQEDSKNAFESFMKERNKRR